MNKKFVFILILLTLLLYARPFWQWFQAKKGAPGPSFHVVSALPGATNERPFMKEEFIGPPGAMQVHAASMAELGDGTLAAVWYGGEYEGSKDTRIYFTTRVPRAPGEEGEWSLPRGIVDRVSAGKELKRYIKKTGNPLIFSGPGDRLWLIYVTVSVGGWSGSALNVTVSHDRGRNWAPGRRLTLSPFFNVSELVRNNPLPLTGGGYVIPIYHECIGIFSELLWFFPKSDGKGLNYRKTRLTWGKRFLQPTIVALSPDSAVTFHRGHGVRKNIGMSFGEDGGETWTAPGYIELPNPDAGIAALLLSDGRVLLAYNHHRETRENLSLAVSDRGFRSWRRAAVLEDTPGEEFSYPYLLPTGDGSIHLVYTWKRQRIKHVVFNEAWLHKQVSDER